MTFMFKKLSRQYLLLTWPGDPVEERAKKNDLFLCQRRKRRQNGCPAQGLSGF